MVGQFLPMTTDGICDLSRGSELCPLLLSQEGFLLAS